MTENGLVTINSRKFDGKVHKTWHCRLIDEAPDYFVFLGEFQTEVRHAHLGVIRPGTLSYEYYWKKKWYNVFRFHEPNARFRNFYCNINMPPEFSGDVLNYIDLDVDVLVWRDFSFEILDLKEFEENAQKYRYSSEVKDSVKRHLSELIHFIEYRKFPFDAIV